MSRRGLAKRADRRGRQPAAQYWHAGWKGRRVGELLVPLALQQGTWAEISRRSVMIARATSTDAAITSGTIYDITKVFVTADRAFAEAWSVLSPPPALRDKLKTDWGLEAGAYYGVELLDSHGDPLADDPEVDPDYANGKCYQVELARVISVHRARMTETTARIHLDRMAGNLR